jgi:hypothetical protein
MSKIQYKNVWFHKEANLRDAMLECMKSIVRSKGACFAKTEVPVGARIPDIVMVCVEEQPRRDLWPSKWTFRHAAVVWHLRIRKKLKIESLSRRLFEEPKRIEPLITHLINSGAVIRTPSGCYSLSFELASISTEVIAVETKLKRWKEALLQATAYNDFADRSIVAMSPDGIPDNNEAKKLFTKSGIGLLAVNGGNPKIIYPGRRKSRNCVEKEYILGSALGRTGQSRWSAL